MKVSNEEISKWNDAPDVKIDTNVRVENLEEWKNPDDHTTQTTKKKNGSRNS